MDDYKGCNDNRSETEHSFNLVRTNESKDEFNVNDKFQQIDEILSKTISFKSDQSECIELIQSLINSRSLKVDQIIYLLDVVFQLLLFPQDQYIDFYLSSLNYIIHVIDLEEVKCKLTEYFPKIMNILCSETTVRFELLLSIESIIYSRTNLDIMIIPFDFISDNLSKINPYIAIKYLQFSEYFKLTDNQLIFLMDFCIDCIENNIENSFETLSNLLSLSQMIYKNTTKIKKWINTFQNLLINEEIFETIPIISVILQYSKRYDLIEPEIFFPSDDPMAASIGCQTIKYQTLNGIIDSSDAINMLCTDAVDYRVHVIAVEFALDIVIEMGLFSEDSFDLALHSVELESNFVTPKALFVLQQCYVNEENIMIRDNMLSIIQDNYDDITSNIEVSCPKMLAEFESFIEQIK